MEKIKALSVILIALGSFSGVITSLMPSKRNINIFRIIFVSVAILSVATCVLSMDFSDFEIDTNVKAESIKKSSEVEEKIDLSIETGVAEEIKNQIDSELIKKEIFADKISVQTDRTQEGSIYIRGIEIVLNEDQKYLKKAVEELLKTFLDEETLITVG